MSSANAADVTHATATQEYNYQINKYRKNSYQKSR